MHILLADDHGLFRDSMSVWLKQLDDSITIDFADSFESVETGLTGASECSPYALLMLDLGMPGMRGAYSVGLLRQQFAKLPIIVVSADERPLVIRSCLQSGASGYVTKSSSGNTILDAVQRVLTGKTYTPTCALLNENDAQYNFNKKQMELLSLLAEGLSNRDIARRMYLSEGTVKQYVTRMLRLLSVDNRMQAGLKARKLLGITDDTN